MHKSDSSILREYDIRGIFNQSLKPIDAFYIGKAFANKIVNIHADNNIDNLDNLNITVGYDGRLSSPELADSLMNGIISTGVNIKNIGLCPTPALYFSVYHANANGGVMITGSHNPAEYNGFKFMIKDKSFFGEQIQDLGQLIADNN